MATTKVSFILFCFYFIVNSLDINSQTQGEVPWPTLMASPWPMIKHDPQGTGRSPYIGPKNPTILWTRDLEYGVFSGPVIDLDGNIYVGTNTWLPQDTTNYFYSFNPHFGTRWTFLTGETYATDSGYLISSDSTIYFASQGGYIYAVDFFGNLKWKNDYGTNIFSHVMNIDLDSSIYFTSADGNLYSVYKHNGDIRWKVSYQGGWSSGFFASSPTFSPDGQTIYIAGLDSNLFALNLDGSLKWKLSCGPVSVIPVVDNEGNIYIITKLDSAGLYSLNLNGTIRWIYNFDNWHSHRSLMYCAAIDKNGNIYFPCTINGEAKIISVDYYGNFRWEYSFEQPDEMIYVPLICDSDGTIYFGSTFGYYYYALSSEGEMIWKIPLNGYQVDNSGAIGSDGTLYIGSHLSSVTTGQEKTLIAIRDTVTSVENERKEVISYQLEQNYPNPFNSITNISYSIPQSGRVTLTVYDIMGSEVATILDRNQEGGSYNVIFQSKYLASGIYFYTLSSGDYMATKKLILLK